MFSDPMVSLYWDLVEVYIETLHNILNSVCFEHSCVSVVFLSLGFASFTLESVGCSILISNVCQEQVWRRLEYNTNTVRADSLSCGHTSLNKHIHQSLKLKSFSVDNFNLFWLVSLFFNVSFSFFKKNLNTVKFCDGWWIRAPVFCNLQTLIRL